MWKYGNYGSKYCKRSTNILVHVYRLKAHYSRLSTKRLLTTDYELAHPTQVHTYGHHGKYQWNNDGKTRA